MNKQETERKPIDLSYGFKETVELQSKQTIMLNYTGNKSDKVLLAYPIYKKLRQDLGSYGIMWYFVDYSTTIKYFEDNEWQQADVMYLFKR